MLGRKMPKEFRDKLSASRIGIKFSESHRLNLRLSHLGKKLPDEQKKKISEGIRAAMTPEFLARRSEISKKNVIPRHVIDGLKEINSKPVICLESGFVYDSTVDAARSTGLSTSAIQRRCNGQLKSKSVLNFSYL
jgi:hypothetical protein